MRTLIKEGWLGLSISYYELALRSMGASHEDYPAVLMHVSGLRDQLKSLRGEWSAS